MRCAAIILGAGQGSRFGAPIPKQFYLIRGEPVIRFCARTLAEFVDFLQPVGEEESLNPALAGIQHLPPVKGGKRRQDSVLAGLEALIPYRPDLVFIHDGARPFIPEGLLQKLTAAIDPLAFPPVLGAVPALPVSDTLKFAADSVLVKTVPREGLWRAQTPQLFSFEPLLRLHQTFKEDVTDDAALFEKAGYCVKITSGSEKNMKLTYPEDTERLEQVLTPSEKLCFVGQGFDVHAFAPDRPLIICGVTIPFERGLAGHSDADVGIHALCDAIYGALAEGDIGRHFPPSSDKWKNADSSGFLLHAAQRIKERQGELINADITLICEKPKMAPYIDVMQEKLAALMQVSARHFSVKATTTEKLGFTGREEGIAALATVSLLLPRLKD